MSFEKPENIFITREGRIKILDFDLTKLMRQEEAATAARQTTVPTAAVGTAPGLVLDAVG